MRSRTLPVSPAIAEIGFGESLPVKQAPWPPQNQSIFTGTPFSFSAVKFR